MTHISQAPIPAASPDVGERLTITTELLSLTLVALVLLALLVWSQAF